MSAPGSSDVIITMDTAVHLRNVTVEGVSEAAVTTTFWIVFTLQISLPFILTCPRVLGCRKSFQKMIRFDRRHINYDTQLLRRPEARTSIARCTSILFYRHRPLPLEILRICLEVAILLHFLSLVRLVVLLSLWCIFDLAQGLHVLNLVYLKHTPSARTATSLATYIATLYCLLYGFPLGFISKLMWIVWLGSRLTFQTIFVPFYIEAVAALVFAVFFMLPNMLWRAGENGCKAVVTRLQVLLLLLCFFVMWLLVYFNVTVCGSTPLDDSYSGTDFKALFYCAPYFRSWTTSFMPVSVLLMVSLFVLFWATASKGMIYRFLPEISFLWNCGLVFSAGVHSLDKDTGFTLGIRIAAVLISILTTMIVNFNLIIDIVRTLKLPAIIQGTRANPGVDDMEVKRRIQMRQTALKDYIHEGGKTMLRGTLLRHLKKRDRTKECVVCLDPFSKVKENTEPTSADGEMNPEEGKASDAHLGIIRKCGHYFHFNCVWDWIVLHNTCPLCRTTVEVTKDSIKTVHYDDVKYALEKNRGTVSAIGTVSEIVSREARHQSSSAAGTAGRSGGSALQNTPATAEIPDESIYEEPEDIPADDGETNQGITHERSSYEQSNTDNQQSRRDTAIPDGAYVVGAREKGYKTHSRSSSKYCGVCKKKFLGNGQNKDIVVGYLRGCGHFFHCECIDSYIREEAQCPTCQLGELKRTKHAMPNGRVHRQISLIEVNEKVEQMRHLNENQHCKNIPGQSKRENPPARGSRRQRDEPTRQGKNQRPSNRSRSRGSNNADLIKPRLLRGQPSSAADQDTADGAAGSEPQPGPSRPRNGYVKNPNKYQLPSGGPGAAKRTIQPNEVLFAFLSDVQNDVKRHRARKRQASASSTAAEDNPATSAGRKAPPNTIRVQRPDAL